MQHTSQSHDRCTYNLCSICSPHIFPCCMTASMVLSSGSELVASSHYAIISLVTPLFKKQLGRSVFALLCSKQRDEHHSGWRLFSVTLSPVSLFLNKQPATHFPVRKPHCPLGYLFLTPSLCQFPAGVLPKQKSEAMRKAGAGFSGTWHPAQVSSLLF